MLACITIGERDEGMLKNRSACRHSELDRRDYQINENLNVLLRERYSFVGTRLPPGAKVLDVGAGYALSAVYLKDLDVILTDVTYSATLDVVASADRLPFRDESFDAVLLIAVLHHLEFPLRGLDEAQRVVRPSGKIFILEPHGSWFLKAVLRLTKHEYFDSNIDPYAERSCKSGDPDPASGNNAIGDIIFGDLVRFKRRYPQLSIEHWRMNECFSFVNSGGVNISAPYVPLPPTILKLITATDRFLTNRWPGIFAFVQEIVLTKTSLTPKAHCMSETSD
jgi:SAM-dependent methyltransferase